MFLLDDILLKLLGIELKPFDMIWIMELLRDYSLKEMYNVKEINNHIKENRLLFEVGMINEDEYKEKHELLVEERERAEEIMANLSGNIQIQEGI